MIEAEFTHQDDKDRIEIGARLRDDLYAYFKGKP